MLGLAETRHRGEPLGHSSASFRVFPGSEFVLSLDGGCGFMGYPELVNSGLLNRCLSGLYLKHLDV